jgi:hypothetical protein
MQGQNGKSNNVSAKCLHQLQTNSKENQLNPTETTIKSDQDHGAERV